MKSLLASIAAVLVATAAAAAPPPTSTDGARAQARLTAWQAQGGSSDAPFGQVMTTDHARALAARRAPTRALCGSPPARPPTTSDEARVVAAAQAPSVLCVSANGCCARLAHSPARSGSGISGWRPVDRGG